MVMENNMNQFDTKHYFFDRDSRRAFGYWLEPSDFTQTKQKNRADTWVFAVAALACFVLVIL